MEKRIGDYYYCTDDLLGEGSFAAVYKARDANNNYFALKVMEKKCFEPDEIVRIKNEIKILSKIEHRFFVKMYNWYEDNDNFYLVFEFCEDGSLEGYSIPKGSLSSEDVCKYLKQIAFALSDLHIDKKVLIHRDLKPENILLKNGNIKIADLGFAKTIDETESDKKKSHTRNLGTPYYKSPQVLDDKAYSCKTDVWSTGVMVYEWIAGEVPWDANNQQELLLNIKKNPQLSYPKGTDEDLVDLLKNMLQILEEKRLSWSDVLNHAALKFIDVDE